MRIVEATGNYLLHWDEYIDRSVNGTIFHKRRFLQYHGNKFSEKEKFLIVLDGDCLYAQIAVSFDTDSAEKTIVRSPYGASYGGFVFQKYPSYKQGREVVLALLEYLEMNQVDNCFVTHPIACCSQCSMDTFYFNLLEQGFVSVNRDISSVVVLQKEKDIMQCISTRGRRMARKAEKNNIYIQHKAKINDFWKVLEKTFTKLGKEPTHTLEEFMLLHSLLPNEVYVDVACYEEIPVAGIAYFVINGEVKSSFYLCQDSEYQHMQGLSLLIVHALRQSQEQGYQYFDFGTSTNNMIARENIFSFKENYSKSGMFRETFQWSRKS